MNYTKPESGHKMKDPLIFFWTAIIVLTTLNAVVFGVIIMTSPDNLRIQYIPDDAYYYLTLSRNFSTLGFWTFDSGVSRTSGFHLLFAYILSGMFSFLHLKTNSFVTYSIMLSLFFAVASMILMCLWGIKHKKVLFLMFLALVIGSRNFVYNTVSVTEWSLTILISSLYCISFFAKHRKPYIKFTDFLVIFTLGFLGSIARSDFGLLPLSIALAAFALSLIADIPNRHSQFAFWGLMGTLAGLLLVFIHNYIFTNEILQSSAKMKAYWAELGTPNYYAGPFLIGIIIGLTGLLLLGTLLAIAVFSKFIRKKKANSSANNQIVDFHSDYHNLLEDQNTFSPYSNHGLFIMFISAFVCGLGYILFYAHNAVIQPWYTANFLAPLLMFIFAISDYITVSLHNKTRILFSLLFLSALVFKISSLYPVDSMKAPWPHQKFMYAAGVYLKENHPNCRVGAWNAGIIGYYEGGHIVNLDGLVNNDIYFYAVNNDLPRYLSNRNICYIVDFTNMLDFEFLRIRGGYNDHGFLANLKPQVVFDKGEYGWKNLTLYYIDR